MHKKILFVLLSIALINYPYYLNAQEHKWDWIKLGESQYEFQSKTIASDSRGNVYIAGFIRGKMVQFDQVKLTNTNEEEEIFLAKYDSLGTLKWAKKFGSYGSDNALCTATDQLGNVYIGGYFRSSSITFGTSKLMKTGSFGDGFFAKLDSSGNVIWARSIRGDDNDEIKSIAVDKKDNVYITGCTASSSLSFGKITQKNTKGTNMFIGKYNSAGNAVWAKIFNGVDGVFEGTAMVINDKNELYLTGFFNASIVLNKDTLAKSENFKPNIYTMKFDTSGKVKWTKRYENSYYSTPTSICSDKNGDIIVGGSGDNNATNYFILMKYSTDGTLLWDKQALVTSLSSSCKDVITGSDNNIYIIGEFKHQEFKIDSVILKNSNKIKKEEGWYSDIFVGKIDPLGKLIWAKCAGGSGDDIPRGITINKNSDLTITGDFREKNISFGEKSVTLSGDNNGVFITRLKCINK